MWQHSQPKSPFIEFKLKEPDYLKYTFDFSIKTNMNTQNTDSMFKTVPPPQIERMKVSYLLNPK